MGGVFMKKFAKILTVIMILSVLTMCCLILSDHSTLQKNILRLHVVANSDSAEDQALKLRVRDAMLEVLNKELGDSAELQQAKASITSILPRLEKTANQILAESGSPDTAVVTLAREEFPTREYDTFTLPAGIYESLRIRIGKAEGKNWWCVVFPSLCVPATSDGFRAEAVDAGFSRDLTNTLTGEPGYEVRFFFLDLWGRLENFFHRG